MNIDEGYCEEVEDLKFVPALDLTGCPLEEWLIRSICYDLTASLSENMEINWEEADRRVKPFLNLALKLRKHLSAEIIHDVAESLRLFDPTPSEYEQKLADVQQWLLRELQYRFQMDLPGFLLYLGRLNRDTRRPDPVLTAYIETCKHIKAEGGNGGKLKPVTVQDYFDSGLIRDDACSKLITIFNAVRETRQLTDLKKVGLQFAQEAAALKQKKHPERKNKRPAKTPSETS
jgi:hypothetical protein